MSLDEAIERSKNVAENPDICQKCRNEHIQLSKWLEELKRLRRILRESEDTYEQD